MRKKVIGTIVPGAGWHYSWFGGKDSIVKKLESYSHSEFNLPQFKTREHVDHCMLEGIDLFLRGTGHIIPINEIALPNYIANNIEQYKHWIHPNHR
jgi:beta-1,4-mannosyl-glycoprotein beta-1,4-N-acetylglucosaminyltransferase